MWQARWRLLLEWGSADLSFRKAKVKGQSTQR
jgi:hypothetical protein